MPLGSKTLEIGLSVFMKGISALLHPTLVDAAVRELESGQDQKIRAYMNLHHCNPDEAVRAVGHLTIDRNMLEANMRRLLELSVQTRLRGAIANYEDGDQLECLRHILLALNAIFDLIGWKTAAEYLEKANWDLYSQKS